MRREKTVECTLTGRDSGKRYFIIEMPASRAEKWAARAFLALSHAGIEIPDEMQGAGMAAIAVVGLQALGRVSWAEAEPLLDEMMGCVQRIEERATRALVEDDIEEVATRLWLRDEVFETHVGFSIAAVLSASAAAAKERPSNPTRTSRRQSRSSSRRG